VVRAAETPPPALLIVQIAVVVNPLSGSRGRADRGRSRAERAAAVLDRLGVDGEIFLTERGGHAFDLARAAVDRGARRVVAWGGDGTVNEVGRAVLHGPAALGIVPSGSGNGLARALGLPRDAEAALAHAVSGPLVRIDAGEIGGHVFLNVAGLGFDARVAHAFSRRGGARGFQRYVRVVSRELFGYTPSTYGVEIDGEVREYRAFLLSIANGPQWGNGARIAPGARLDDGLLDVVIAQAPGPLAAALQVPRLFTGTIDRAAGVVTTRAAAVTITLAAPTPVHLDGEPITCGPGTLHGRVLAGTLLVCA
jgi:diacylglycerol kinase (ATP)